jgi:hypothetical protein
MAAPALTCREWECKKYSHLGKPFGRLVIQLNISASGSGREMKISIHIKM